MHAFAAGHDTPVNGESSPPGMGTLTRVHWLPSKRSARARNENPFIRIEPTAMHALDAEHDTATSAPWATGLACVVHEDPFQFAINGFASASPTAMHCVAV